MRSTKQSLQVSQKSLKENPGSTVTDLQSNIIPTDQMKKNLRECDVLFELIFELAPDAYILIDFDGRFVLVNKAAEQLSGYTEEELTGRNFYELNLLPRKQVPIAIDKLKKARVGVTTGPDEFLLKNRGGETIPVEVKTLPIRIGESALILVILRDIREWKNYEAILKEKEEKYRIVVENTNSFIYIASPDYRIEYINPRWIEKLGYDPSGKGKSCYEAIAGRTTPCPDCKNKEVLSGKTIRFEKELPDGSIFDVYNARVDYHNGKSSKISIAQDITQKKRIHNILTAKERYFRSLIQSLHEDVIVIDRNYRITDVNHHILITTGKQRNDIIGQPCYKISHDYEEPCEKYGEDCKLKQVFKLGKTLHCQHVHNRENGSETHVDLIFTPMKNEQERITHVVETARDVTDLILTQKSLRESELKFRTLFEAVPIGIAVVSAYGKILVANAAIAKMTGYNRKELERKRIKTIFLDPNDLKKLRKKLRENHLVYEDEIDLIKKDGTIFPAEFTLMSFLFEGKNCLLLLIKDNSTRKQAEEELAKLQKAVEASNEVIFMTDPDGTFIYCNPEFTRIYGFQRKEIIGKKTPRILKSGLYDQSYYAQFWKAILSKRPLKGEYRNRTKSGKLIDVEGSVNAIVNDRGDIIGFLAIQRDISERNRMLDQLRTLSQTVEQGPFSILITDRKGTIQYVNPHFTKITGYTPEEVKGKTPRFLQSGKTPLEDYEKLWRTITAGQIWKGEFHNKKKNGELYWEGTTIAPIKNQHGEITHFVAIKEDITEKKRLEEQFRQAQKMEAIGRLAGGVAHDFNNLLTVITGYCDFILNDLNKEDPLREDLKEIRDAGNRAAELTRQLLAFSRKEVVKTSPVNLNWIIKNLERMLKRLIGEDIEFISSLCENPDIIKADPGLMEQVIINIVVNARDAMPDGGTLTIKTDNVILKRVRHSVHDSLLPGKYLRLRISDTGMGMSREVLEKIFEPFFTTKEVGKGTGLGLSTVYGIVKQNGGFIRVDSKPGRGTTFELYFPGIEEAALSDSDDEREVSNSSGNETILLVEDDAAVRSLAKKILEKQGYRVYGAGTGMEALKICEKINHPVHLVITDVVMPGMNGYQLAEKIRRLYPHVKILFISGYSDETIRKNQKQEAEFYLLNKPFNDQKLISKVRKLLDDTSGS